MFPIWLGSWSSRVSPEFGCFTHFDKVLTCQIAGLILDTYSFIHNWFISARMLASNINLLTHYAKGTLSLFKAKAAYKTTNSNLSFTVLFAIAYILYLAFEEGSPLSNYCRISTTYTPSRRRRS